MMKKWYALFLFLVMLIITVFAFSEENQYPEKVFDSPKLEYTVTEKEGLLIPIDLHGMPIKYIEHKAANDNAFFHYLDDAGLHLLPIKAGKATITLTNKLNKKDKTVITVVVDDTAVYAKGETSPLRAYIIPYDTILTNEKCEGKYIILGGSGKYTYIGINGEAINPGQSSSISAIKPKGKDKGTFSYNLNMEMTRFQLTVRDSAGDTVEVYSPVIIYQSEIDVLKDTFWAIIAPGKDIHFKYYISGGSGSYNTEIHPLSSKPDFKSKAVEGENELTYTVPEHIDQSLYVFSVTDKSKNVYREQMSINRDQTNNIGITVDKPFAKVGDEIHFTTIMSDSSNMNMEYTFAYWVKDPEHFTYIQTQVTNVQKTENGYSLVAELPGIICVTLDDSFITGAMVREMVRVSTQ